MELDLSFQENFYLKKHLFDLKTHRRDGLILQVHHSLPDLGGENRRYKFIHASFNYLGTILAVSDLNGHIFIINLEVGSYWQLPEHGFTTLISFPVFKKQELLISLDNTSILFVDCETGNTTGVLHGHSVPATEISYSDDGNYYLTSCSTEAIIWDSSTYVQIHKLSLKVDIYLKKIIFMPVTNCILACFQDDTINIWKFGSFECIKRIVPETWKNHYLKSIAISKNGKAMVIGGQSSNLVIFCLNTWVIKNVIEFPDTISGVQQLEFLSQVFDGGENKILVVLTVSQELFFFDTETLGFLKWMHQINGLAVKFSLSCNGKFLASILATGEVNVYTIEKVLYQKTKSHIEEDFLSRSPSNRLQSSSSKRSQKTYESLSSIQKEIKEVLDVKKLLPILKQFGEYPQAYRTLIWKTILQLPENQECFFSLSMKSCHPCYSKIELKYPLTNKSLCNSLKKLLSNLAHWCPLFGEVDFIPEFAFPFVKLFHSNPLTCFEVVATVIVNWCQNWFEFYPFPPINLLTLLESILGYHDPDLLEFYLTNNITTSISVCPLYHTAFSEVLSKSEWLKLWDHILSNEVSFLFMAIIAYNVVCQNAVKNLRNHTDIEAFFRTQNPVDMKMLISKTYQFLKDTPEDIHTRQFFSPFRPLDNGGTYNKFLAYPKLILDSGSEKLQSIRKEESKLLEEQFKALNMKKAFEKKLSRDNTTDEKEKIFQELEEKIRNTVEEEEDRLLVERQKLQNLRQELKLKELEVLEKTRDKALKKKIKQKEIEFERLLKDISKRKYREKVEVGTIEREIRNYYSDLLLRKCQLEMELGLDDTETHHDEDLLAHREKLTNDLVELKYEWDNHYHGKHIEICNKITKIKSLLCDVETEIAKEVVASHSEKYLKDDQVLVKELKEKVSLLEDEIEKLIKKNMENLRNQIDHKKFPDLRFTTQSGISRKPKKIEKAKQEVKNNNNKKTNKTDKYSKTLSSKKPKNKTICQKKVSKTKLKNSNYEDESTESPAPGWNHFIKKVSTKLNKEDPQTSHHKSKFTCSTQPHSPEHSDSFSNSKTPEDCETCHHYKGDCQIEEKVQKNSSKKFRNPSSVKFKKGEPLSSSTEDIFKSASKVRSQIIEDAKRRQRFQ